MTGLGPLLRKELLEQWRTRRLPVVAIAFAVLGIGSPLLARFTPELIAALGGLEFQISFPTPTLTDAVDQFLRNLGQAGILTAVLLAMGSVANEKERGTAALILSKPVSRGAFLLAKLVAMGTTLAVSLAGAALAAYVYTGLLFEWPDAAGWTGMTAMLLLALFGFMAITLLGSTLTRSALAAAGLGIAGMILLALVSALPNVAPYTPVGLSGAPAAAVALGEDPGPLIGPLLVNATLVAALGLAAWAAFRRQEL